MRIVKKIGIALLFLFIAIQFVRPARNKRGQLLSTDITKKIEVPPTILAVLQKACYDCHCNNTRYPWYMNVQPMGWVMADHIREGKDNLNFSEFGTYSRRKQANKLRAIAKTVTKGTMPIHSYTLMHTDAKLSKETRDSISAWALRIRDSLSANH